MNEEIKLVCILGGVGLVSVILTLLGFRGISDKSKKIDYKDQNFLILGIMGDVLFLFALIFYSFNRFLGVSLVDKSVFTKIEAIGLVIALFIGGLHGILNCKDYRKDAMYYRLYTYQISLSAIGFIGLILYFFIWGWK